MTITCPPRLLTLFLSGMALVFAPMPASAQIVRDTIRSEHFTARALGVEPGEKGSLWLTAEFTAGTIFSQAEALIVRSNGPGCDRPSYMEDAEGRRLIEARCVGYAEPFLDPIEFYESGQKQVVRFRFVSPKGVTSHFPPYDAAIKLHYRVTSEEDRPVPETVQILTFSGVGQ